MAGMPILHIHARAWVLAVIGSPETLELIANGSVVAKKSAGRSNPGELQMDTVLRAGSSQWIAARVTANNGALAHTSPVYVSAGGVPVRDEAHLPALVEKRLRALDFIGGRLQQGYAKVEAQALTERIEEARAKYRKLLNSR